MHAPVRSSFATADPEEGVAMVADAYGDNQLRISGSVEGFRMTLSRVDLGGVRLDEYANSLIIEYSFEPMTSLDIVRLLGGTVEYRTSRGTSLSGPGDVLLTPRPGEAFESKVDGARLQVIGMDLPLLADLTGESTLAVVRRFRPGALPPAHARFWQRAVTYATDVAASAAADSPLVLGALRRSLAAAVLTAFDPDVDLDRPGDRGDAVPATVRRAIAFIETNLDLDISVADIARAAHVSVRAVQLAFRRHLDTTPMRYLRRARLDLAHADLQAAVIGDGTTVTDIAIRWGYADLSRFAADYHVAYGEHPHVTLGRLG